MTNDEFLLKILIKVYFFKKISEIRHLSFVIRHFPVYTGNMPNVTLSSLDKKYDGIAAVLDFNLEIADAEFVVLCGPPGAGKSAVLRLIAGLEKQDGGEIRIGGEILSGGAKERDIAMMFQNFGLFAAKSVYDNLAYPLKIRKVPREEIRTRVLEAAEKTGVSPALLSLKPKKLSAEESKRVQLARSVLRKPKLFLLDEPLLGLEPDAQERLTAKILQLHSELNIPFVFATIEPETAMRLNKRTVVMTGGVIRQIGTPDEILKNPKDEFVRLFFEEPV